RLRPRLRRAQTLNRRLPQRVDALARRRLQVVDGLHTVQLTFETVELTPKLNTPTKIPDGSIELPQDLATPVHHRLILRAARLVKERGDRLIGHRLDPIDPEQRGLTAKRLDLLHQPLKQLSRLRILGQDPDRTPKPDRAHSLKL